MDLRKLLLHWTILLSFVYFSQNVYGCQPQVCRRRRAVTEGTVKLKLHGCTGKSPPWVRQVAFCLGRPMTSMALLIKQWYEEKYEECSTNGCTSYVSGGRGEDAVEDCVKCWKTKLEKAPFLNSDNVSFEDVEKCLDKYIYAFLNDDLPTLKFENRFKSHIDLAAIRPAEHWWSVTVKLPCKPKSFVYWNAYCANSFARELQEGDYVLVQNKLITSNRITFFVEFSDSCTFEPDDITIVWDESFPAASLPQVSSFPSKVPPEEEEEASIFFDPVAEERLRIADGGKQSPEVQFARHRAKKSRFRRSMKATRLGVLFPCSVKSFAPKNPYEETYKISGGGNRFLIDAGSSSEFINLKMNFTLKYGYEETGCLFDSGDIKVVPNPPSDWFASSFLKSNRLIYRKKNVFACTTCENKLSDLDCLDRGMTKPCAENEICQTEVRQIRHNLKLVTKACKQKHACAMEALVLQRGQCKPGIPGSVCRCCCSTSMCNSGRTQCSL